jgi:2-polyprenyl-6-hydroxyphenyl methylase/3-demethylubiquinone-9 3-methyltransferase
LKLCYEIAPPRVQQYLREEVNFVLGKVASKDLILDLGCGYGRTIPQLEKKAKKVVGIDISLANLLYGSRNISDLAVLNMNVINLGFQDHTFDLVICIQNGIAAFHVNKRKLIQEAIRVTKLGGKIIFSTYSEKFWEHRLNWFQLQSKVGLLGQIDYKKTKDGVIICKDGFKATTIPPRRFLSITKSLNVNIKISEVDESSLFYELMSR